MKKAKKKLEDKQSMQWKVIEARISPVDEMEVLVNMLVYGRSGTGKTHFIGTAPHPILLLDCKDKGTDTVRGHGGIDVLRVETWDDVEEVYWYLKSGDSKYKTVAIDTLTGLQEIAIEAIVGEDGGRLTRQGWGDVSGLMKTWLVHYRDLNMNVIFTAQDKVFTVSEEEADSAEADSMLLPEVGPQLMPSVAKVINAAVGVIGNTFIRERIKKVKNAKGEVKEKAVIEYCMRIGPHARYLTKIRRDAPQGADSLPGVIVSPTFDQILQLSHLKGE